MYNNRIIEKAMSLTNEYNTEELTFISNVKRIVSIARQNAYHAINIMQVVSNWLVGQRIVLQEQRGKARADYGKRIIGLLSAELTEEYGSGYSETNLRNMRKFYQTFNTLQIRQALPADFNEVMEDIQQALPAKSGECAIPLYPQLFPL